MKKYFIGVLAALMLFAFTACDSQVSYTDKTLVRLGVETVTERDYLVGQEFDPSTIRVTAYFRDGSSSVADATKDLYFDYNFATADAASVVKIYYQNAGATTGVNNTADYKVAVYKPTKLEATGTPAIAQYYQYSGTSNVVTLDNSGITVNAVYNGNQKMALEADEFTLTASTATVGEGAVTANYVAEKSIRNTTDIKVKIVADTLDPESFKVSLAAGKEQPVLNQTYVAGDYVVSAKMMSGKDVTETQLKSMGTLTYSLVNPGEDQTLYVAGSKIEGTFLPTDGIKYTDTVKFSVNVAPANDYPVSATLAWKDNTAPSDLKKGAAIGTGLFDIEYTWKSNYSYKEGKAPVVNFNVIPSTVQESDTQYVWVEFPAYPDVTITNNGTLSFTVAK